MTSGTRESGRIPNSEHEAQPWRIHAIVPDFTALKHRLDDVKARFPALAYYHIGDTDTDERYATAAGFRFLKADAEAHRAWSATLFPGV